MSSPVLALVALVATGLPMLGSIRGPLPGPIAGAGASGPGLEPASGVPLPVDAFERGVEAYRRGDYDEAVALWEATLEEDLAPRERARVAFDLGNAAWRQERTLEAVGWYTMAVRLDPRHADAWANLELARAAAELEPADRGDLRSTVERILDAPTPVERRWGVLGALALLAVALAGEALRGGALWRRASAVLACVLALACIPWMHGMLEDEGDPMLVLATPSVALRSEPRQDLPSIGELRAGDEVQRIDELPDWVRVEREDGTRGWVREHALFSLSR